MTVAPCSLQSCKLTTSFLHNYRISKITVSAQQHLNPFKMRTLEPSTKTESQHMRIKGGVQNYVTTVIMCIRKAAGKAQARRMREFILVTWNCGWCFLSYSNVFVIWLAAVMSCNEVTHSPSAFQIERKWIQTPWTMCDHLNFTCMWEELSVDPKAVHVYVLVHTEKTKVFSKNLSPPIRK